jgi:Na+-driven multidrug efflux pump
VALAAYVPIVLWVRAAGATGSPVHDVVVLWLAFTALMVIRAVVLGWRARQDGWMRLGA